MSGTALTSGQEVQIEKNYTQEELLQLWSAFGDVPLMSESDEIEESFLHFPIGTDRIEIWQWFDQKLENGLVRDCMPALLQ